MPEVKIEDFLSLELIYNDYYESLNKQIRGYTATSADDQTLTFNVEFAEPADISTDLLDLDYLRIEFLMRELIIDSQNYLLISESKTKNEVKVTRQYSEKEYEELINA